MKRTPLRSRVGLTRRTRLRPVSEKRAANASERLRVRNEVFTRDGWTCQARVSPLCPHGLLEAHHLRKASQGGTYTAENLLTTCHGCNQWIEDHPAEARAAGLVVFSWEKAS